MRRAAYRLVHHLRSARPGSGAGTPAGQFFDVSRTRSAGSHGIRRHPWVDRRRATARHRRRSSCHGEMGFGGLPRPRRPNSLQPSSMHCVSHSSRAATWPLVSRAAQTAVFPARPTLVIHIPNATIPKAAVQHVAELIPTSTFHVLPQIRAGSSLGQIVLPAIDVVEEFITGTAHAPDSDRSLGTVLFTDVVASTELLERVGDAAYRELRSDHERAVRLAVETAGGRLLTVTGDGTLSVFDSPTRAVRCAETICREAESAGMAVRAGIHTGELEHDAMNVTGLTVHIGARVGAAAEPGQVLVSRTVRDLVAGSGLTFASRGEHRLKGISGSWELFVVTHVRERPRDLPPEESMQTSMDKMVLQTARTAPAFVRAAVRLGNAIERRRARAD